MTNVIELPTRPVYRSLAYRYHVPAPDLSEDAQTVLEWAIEQQLSHVLDTQDVDTALQLLHGVNPGLDPGEVEHLLDLADDVAAQAQPSHRFFKAVDDYADALCALAKKLRGGSSASSN